MVLSPDGKGIFRPEPTISFRYHQWKVLAVVIPTFVWKLIILLHAPQLMVSVAIEEFSTCYPFRTTQLCAAE